MIDVLSIEQVARIEADHGEVMQRYGYLDGAEAAPVQAMALTG